MSGHPSWVFCSTGVNTTVSVLDRSDYKKTHSGPNCIGCHGRIRTNVIALQAPCYGDGFIPFLDHTSELSKFSLIDNFGPKVKGNNFWRF